jgi:hypothetical protein
LTTVSRNNTAELNPLTTEAVADNADDINNDPVNTQRWRKRGNALQPLLMFTVQTSTM